jgi:molybdate transport system ATP-binding protein
VTPFLQASLSLRRSEFTIDVAWEAEEGESVAILGPNGAGKSSVLAMLAGSVIPDEGAVSLGARTLTSVGAGRASVRADRPVLVPPDSRRIGLMGQDPLLFPHLSAMENVAFGLRSQGRPKATARRAAQDWLDRVGLSAFGSRRPGPAPPVVVGRPKAARALAAEPQLLLLDEPLGALDAETVPEIRQVLRSHLRDTGTTSILVTHDVVDAAVLADRLIVLDRGRVVDDGATGAVLATPRSSFGAVLAGLNLVVGTVVDDAGTAGGAAVRTADGLLLSGVAATALTRGERAAAVFRPSSVSVYRSAPGGSPRNHWAATVTTLEPGTAAVRLRTGGDPAVAVDVTPAAVAELGLTPGMSVVLSVKATEVVIHQR